MRILGMDSFALVDLHGAPPCYLSKKRDGSLHLCVDYQALNKVTQKDHYPLPLIADLLDSPGPGRIYMKIDLKYAYHLVQIANGMNPKWLSEHVMVPLSGW